MLTFYPEDRGTRLLSTSDGTIIFIYTTVGTTIIIICTTTGTTIIFMLTTIIT